jgi:hypothetical protein
MANGREMFAKILFSAALATALIFQTAAVRAQDNPGVATVSQLTCPPKTGPDYKLGLGYN